MASKKGVGSSKNGRDSESKRLRREDRRRSVRKCRQHSGKTERNEVPPW